ncbi:MAG: helix-turn-helix domain-containing protein [Luteolibacter sp.]|jgi:AraC-like DNA-binding protein|nr:helix-turn-helix domain-containing protein [Luteolibacter sp.]
MLPQAVNLSFSDCDSFKDVLKHEDAEITQIRAGRFFNTMSLVPLERMVFRYGTKTTPWIACGTAVPGHVSMLVDLNYQIFPTINGIRQDSGPLVQLYGGGSEHCSMTTESGEYALVPIPNQIVENALRDLGIDHMPVDSGCFTALRPESETFRMLLDTIDSLRTSARSSPEMFLSGEVRRTAERELITRLALVIGPAAPPHELKHRNERMRVFRRAQSFLHEKSHAPVYLAELCAATGVPERTLRDIFQSILGVSPLRYLQLRRMRQVRQALQQADRLDHSVKQIALASGFWELGRFAVEYRHLFGESPSETLGNGGGDACGPATTA